MNPIDWYVQDVLSRVAVSEADLARIEADLRAHLEESVASGLTPDEAIERMGPPEEVAREMMGSVAPAFASHARRLGAALFDLVFLQGIAILLAFVAVTGSVGSHSFEFSLPPEMPLAILPLAGLFAVAIPFMYFVVSEWLTGRTLGKWLFGLSVVSESRQAISFGMALVRRLPMLFFPLYIIDGAVTLISEKKQRGIDMLTKTLVLRGTDAKPILLGYAAIASILGLAALAFRTMMFGR